MITAVEFSPQWTGGAVHDDSDGDEHGADGDHGHVEGFNEHVWYDPLDDGARSRRASRPNSKC